MSLSVGMRMYFSSLMKSAVTSQLTQLKSLLVHVQIAARRCVAPSDFQMALSIYSLFKVSIENLVRNKVVICRNFKIQPSELMCMPFWEYEMTLKECENIVEEEKEEEKKNQEDGQGRYKVPSINQYQRQSNQMMKGYQHQIPSIPSMPRMPKI